MDRIIYTVNAQRLNKNGTQIDGWTEDYESKEEAVEAAEAYWYHLADSDKKQYVVFVYEDKILQEEDEEHDEDRRSWNDGFTPIAIYQHMEERR